MSKPLYFLQIHLGTCLLSLKRDFPGQSTIIGLSFGRLAAGTRAYFENAKRSFSVYVNITANWETKYKSQNICQLTGAGIWYKMFPKQNRCSIWIIRDHRHTGVQNGFKDSFGLEKYLNKTARIKIIINLSSYSHVIKRFHNDTKNICFMLFTIGLTDYLTLWATQYHYKSDFISEDASRLFKINSWGTSLDIIRISLERSHGFVR